MAGSEPGAEAENRLAHENADDQKQPDDERLHRAGKIGEPHAVAQRAEKNQGQKHADDATSAAENVDPAEHYGGDDEKQEIAPVVGARRLILADIDERGEARHEPAQREGRDLHELHADA